MVRLYFASAAAPSMMASLTVIVPGRRARPIGAASPSGSVLVCVIAPGQIESAFGSNDTSVS